MIDSFRKESRKIVRLTECKCKEDFRGYLSQFYSKWGRLEGEQGFSKYLETHIATDITRENLFYFNSVK